MGNNNNKTLFIYLFQFLSYTDYTFLYLFVTIQKLNLIPRQPWLSIHHHLFLIVSLSIYHFIHGLPVMVILVRATRPKDLWSQFAKNPAPECVSDRMARNRSATVGDYRRLVRWLSAEFSAFYCELTQYYSEIHLTLNWSGFIE